MALIGTLRNKLGKFVVGAVFISILAFVINDIFVGNNSILAGSGNSVGEIAGKDISVEEYRAALQERETNYILNFNRQPGEREMPTLQEQAWEMLVARNAIESEFEKVGVIVTDDEVWDMIQGKNVDQNIQQAPAFQSPQTGMFDRNLVVRYIQNLQAMGPEAQVRWQMFRNDLGPARRRLKYENLLLSTSYVTTAEAERDYHLQNDRAEVKYLYVPFYAISDTLAQVSDSDLRSYYDRNKKKFKVNATRDLSYVTFPVIASSDDTLDIKTELTGIARDFELSKDDSTFASLNTDGLTPYTTVNPGGLPASLSADSLIVGNVIGPYLDGGNFKVLKVSAIKEDTVAYARANHILIKPKGTTDADKKEARTKAQKILNDLKSGADFATQARESSEDASNATRGGDLGWFDDNTMVKPFSDAAFGARKKGVLPNLVETTFGYHIIEITEVPTRTTYTLASIERTIAPGKATTDEAYRKADGFALNLSGVEDFREKAKTENLMVTDLTSIGSGERRLSSLGESRSVVQWLFRDAKVGRVSDVFELDDLYVVAVMTGESDEGVKSFAAVKEEITPLARNEVKGSIIMPRIGSTEGTLEDLAKSFGTDANVYTSSDLRLNSSSLTGAGFDPIAVGKAFGLENGKRTPAFAGEQGVFVMELTNKTTSPGIGDYTVYMTQLQNTLRTRTSMSIADVIKDKAGIRDERYKFY
jgi:peptidyl-prolyl cis-trans isomerase D